MSKTSLALKIVGGVGCLVLIVIVAPGLFLGGLLVMGSERTRYERQASPDGWREARVQFDDGGALSGFERVVFVKGIFNPSDSPLASCRAFWGHGEAQIDLKWQDNQTLLLQHHFAPKNVADVAGKCGSVRIIAQAVQPYENF